MDVRELLGTIIKRQASDLHVLVGAPPVARINGILSNALGDEKLTAEQVEELINSLLTPEQKEMLTVNKEIDFSFSYGEVARFRVNVYHQKGTMAASLRLIPKEVPEIDSLGLPSICHFFASELKQGLILVTGPTGHGKSTTLAAVLGEINQTRGLHVVTIEDPVEYTHTNNKSIFSQREMRTDCHSWEIALRSALREDADVVMVGEMRDYETIAAALTVAETGHLVFATLHTNSASQTIDRIVDVFPPHQQSQIRSQMAFTLEAVLSLRLIPAIDGGRVLAYEVMLGIPAIKTAIREGKTHMIDNIIQTSGEIGMITMDMSLAELVKSGKVSVDEAKKYAIRPEELVRLLRSPESGKKK